MKNIIVSMLLVVTAFNMQAQQIVSQQQKPEANYLKKSKKQLRTGLILLGSGAAFITGGSIAMNHSESKGENELPFIVGGLALTLSSFPFIISSATNKHKAKLELRRQTVTAGPSINSWQTSVSLKI